MGIFACETVRGPAERPAAASLHLLRKCKGSIIKAWNSHRAGGVCKTEEELVMNKPVLVVMAAGMGSRYGGMKQIDPVGPNGQVIVDYSLYDARRAGFETVIFVIKHEIEDAFKAAIGDRVSKAMNVKYAFQQLEELPAGYTVPEGRVKPWGTCHAVLAAKDLIDGPFAVINADDYYGPEAFRVMYDYLSTHEDGSYYDYCMPSRPPATTPRAISCSITAARSRPAIWPTSP